MSLFAKTARLGAAAMLACASPALARSEEILRTSFDANGRIFRPLA